MRGRKYGKRGGTKVFISEMHIAKL